MFPSAHIQDYNAELTFITVNFRVVKISVMYFSPIWSQKQYS